MKNSLSLGLILSGLLLLNVAAFAQDPDLTAEEVLKKYGRCLFQYARL